MKAPIVFLIPVLLLLSSIIRSIVIYHEEMIATEQEIHEDALHHVALDITRLQNILYNYLPESNNSYEEARVNLAVTAMDHNIKRLLLTDENDKIIIANRFLWEDSNASDISNYDSKLSSAVRNSNHPELSLSENNKHLLIGYYPVVLQLESQKGLPIKRLGTLFIEYSLATQLAAAKQQSTNEAIVFGSSMFFITLLIAILLHFLVSRRLGRLTLASKALAEGNLDTRVYIGGSDELTQLGQAFNEMAERINQDIYHRKKAETELRHLNETLEQRVSDRTALLHEAQRIGQMGNWNWDIDTDDIILSDEVFNIFGYESGEVIPKLDAFLNSIHNDDIPLVRKALDKSIKENTKYSIDYRIPISDNKIRWIHAEGLPKYDESGKATSMSGTVQNITERKIIEENLLQAKEEAERASQAKSEFLSRMSHELRTPMNAILGFSQVLEMSELNEKQKSYVNEIKESGSHLLSLIGELLDLGRIEAGRMAVLLQSVEIETVVTQSIKFVQQHINERNISLNNHCCDQSLSIIADRTRLRQILVNLLSNAIKYNKEGGSVTVDCKVTQDSLVRLSVTDTGLGIPKEQMGNLFVPFERLHAKYSGIDGTGIGLALCKQLVDLMRGNIGVESTSGEGSTFWIELPIAADSNLEDGTDSLQNEEEGVCKVLYVEDNAANLKVVESVLELHADFRLLSATNGNYGIELAKRYLPDVILLDIHLPDIDGFQVLKSLKAGDDTCNIPVIALSADAMQFDIERGISAGFKDYLTKPVDLDALIKVLFKYGYQQNQAIKQQ